MQLHLYRSALAAWLALTAPCAYALTIVEPAPSSVNTISPGDDFASAIMADAWDMDDPHDLMLARSVDLTNQSISGGIYSAQSTTPTPYFFPLDPGIASSVPNHRGARFPIDTGRFRYLTAKVRTFNPSGPQPAPPLVFLQAYFFRDQNAFITSQIGCSPARYYSPGTSWQIVTIDMQASSTCGPFNLGWNGMMGGLRIDAGRETGIQFEMDWMRLTSGGVASHQRYEVVWSDTTGGQYTVTAVDGDDARYILGAGVGGDRLDADFSRLAPGDYRVEVSRAGASTISTGVIRVGAPATVRVTRPDIRGDVSRSFAQSETGNPWGPIDPNDIALTTGLTNINYNNPAGTLTARPTNDDPSIFMQTAGTPINTNHYRSACFTMQIFGPQEVGIGSVARWYWGNTHPTLTASDDIIIEEGVNEYCFEDMAQMPMEGMNQTPWLSNNVGFFRLDPHEFPVSSQCVSTPTPELCRDIRLHSVTLSPFSTAAPVLQLAWTHRDSDSSDHVVRIILDQNRISGDGPEHIIASVNRPPADHAMSIAVPASVPHGKYYVAVETQDSHAQTRAYSTGPVLVEAGTDLIFSNGFQ